MLEPGQSPSLATVAGQPLPSAPVAEQSAPIAGQSPSLAAVAGQPLSSAPVAGQSAPIAGQSPSLAGRKHNSFLGRWFGKDHKKGTEDDIVVATDSEVMIERDRLILSQIKNIAKVNMQAKYRMIGVYDKSYNKWFMAKENKKHWMSLSQQERKKYKVAIRMVEDVDTESLSENDCQDVSFHDARFKQGDICKIVHGNEICDVLRFMHKYE